MKRRLQVCFSHCADDDDDDDDDDVAVALFQPFQIKINNSILVQTS